MRSCRRQCTFYKNNTEGAKGVYSIMCSLFITNMWVVVFCLGNDHGLINNTDLSENCFGRSKRNEMFDSILGCLPQVMRDFPRCHGKPIAGFGGRPCEKLLAHGMLNKTAHVKKSSPVIITLVTGGGFKVGMVLLLSNTIYIYIYNMYMYMYMYYTYIYTYMYVYMSIYAYISLYIYIYTHVEPSCPPPRRPSRSPSWRCPSR